MAGVANGPKTLASLYRDGVKEGPDVFSVHCRQWLKELAAHRMVRPALANFLMAEPMFTFERWRDHQAAAKAADCWAAAIARSLAVLAGFPAPIWARNALRLARTRHELRCIKLPKVLAQPPKSLRYRVPAGESRAAADWRRARAKAQVIFLQHGFYGPSKLSLSLAGRGRPRVRRTVLERRKQRAEYMWRYRHRERDA